MKKLVPVCIIFILLASLALAASIVQHPSFDAVDGIDDGVYSIYYKEDTSDKYAYKTERQRLKHAATFDLDDIQDWHGFRIADYGDSFSISATKLWPTPSGTISRNTVYTVTGAELASSQLQNNVGLILAGSSSPNKGLKLAWGLVQNKFGEWYVKSLGSQPKKEEPDEIIDFNYIYSRELP